MPSQGIAARRRIERLEARHVVFASYCARLRHRHVSARTLESYADCLNIFADWLDDRSPLTVTLADLEAFRAYLANEHVGRRTGRPVSLGRQAYYVAVLRDFYGFCHARHHMLNNPASTLAYPKQPRRIRRDVLTPPEVMRLLRQFDDDTLGLHDFRELRDFQGFRGNFRGLRDQVVLRLMVLSGLRASEVASLNVGDVNLTDREVIVREAKGGTQRIAFIDVETQRVLARYLLASGVQDALLFADRGVDRTTPGGRIDRHHINKLVKRYAALARITKPVTAHSLRRTFCTLMLNSRAPGMNLKAIAEIAGHRRLKTTARYTQLDIASLQSVYATAHPRAASSMREPTTEVA